MALLGIKKGASTVPFFMPEWAALPWGGTNKKPDLNGRAFFKEQSLF